MATIHESRDFISAYEQGHSVLKSVAQCLQREIAAALSDNNVGVHVVAARAKTPDSVRAKLLSKSYTNPARDMTDQLGVRVIVYRGADVDMAARVVRSKFAVSSKHSVDKRLALGLREFGYRSFHLVCRIPIHVREQCGFIGAPHMFEIQIRTILEHAWAEIEHGVVYKSGAALPAEIKRRFASAAGVIELLEGEFARIADDTNGVIEQALARADLLTTSASLDVPHLLATLERLQPEGRSFRQAAASENPFPPGIERRFTLAFSRTGIRSTKALAQAFAEKSFQATLRHYAVAERLPMSEVSHLAICILLLGKMRPSYVEVFFPEYVLRSVSEAIGASA